LRPLSRSGRLLIVDDLIAARKHCVDIELAGHGLGGARNTSRLSQRIRRAQQRLGRHAGIERALARRRRAR
jgi:hypothetical protein